MVLILLSASQRWSSLAINSEPLSERMYSGAPCWATAPFTSSITSADFRARLALRTWHSRVCSSRTVSILMEPPRNVASAIKSHVHTWFLCVALVGSPVERPRRRIFLLVGGTLRPSCRRRRRTWRMPTLQPSSLSRAAILRYPYRGFSSARAWIRFTSSCSRLDRLPAWYQYPDLDMRSIRHPARPEHTPSLTASSTTCFLCPGLTIFFRERTPVPFVPASPLPASSLAPCS